MSILERIFLIQKKSGLSVRKFETRINKSNGYLATLKNRGSFPSADVILTIINEFPEYDIKWLMTGEGSDLKKDNIMLNEPHENYLKDKTIDDLVNEKIELKMKEFKMKEFKDSIVQLILNEIDNEILEARSKIQQENKKTS